jgi:hypothetical protein
VIDKLDKYAIIITWVISSAVEPCFYTAVVGSSNLSSPTIFLDNYNMEKKPKYQDIKDVFCSYPWSEISTKNTGELVVCREQCEDRDTQGYLGNSDRYNIGRDAVIQDVLNSDLHKDIRLHQLQGKWHRHCVNCRDIKNNTAGMMKNLQRRVPEDSEIAKLIRSADPVTGHIDKIKIQTLDLRFGNLCNHACLHCSPAESTLWYEDYNGFFGPDFHKGPGGDLSTKWTLTRNENGKLKANFEPYIKSENFWKILNEIKDDLVDVAILGGEPFIMQDHDKVLDFFIEHDVAKNITLWPASNLSVINPKLIERWKHFKRVGLSGSMDDVGHRFELIRYGGNWKTFEKNLDIVMNQPHIYFWGTSVCYMLPNIFSVPEIENWRINNKNNPNVIYRWIYAPEYMSIDSLPKSAKLEIVEFNRSVDSPRAVALNKFLEGRLDWPEDPVMIDKFIRLMDYLDRTRKVDWRSTLPDLWSLLQRHCGA